MPEVNDKPIRLFNFLLALSALSREHGIVITGGDFDFRDDPQGSYAIHTENTGPEFGWREG